MENPDRLILSKDFPELTESPVIAAKDSLVVKTLSEAGRGGVVLSGSGDVEVTIDPEIWNSRVGEEFRSRCDEWDTLRTAIMNGLDDYNVKKALDLVSEELLKLKNIIVSSSIATMKKSRHLPDVGTVVSVGRNYECDYSVGDQVALRPGDMYLEEPDGCYRVVKDRYDPFTGKFLYDLTDSVPMVYRDGPVARGDWAVAKRKRLTSLETSIAVYSQDVEVEGQMYAYKGERLFLDFPEDWGLTKDHCLIKRSGLLASL